MPWLSIWPLYVVAGGSVAWVLPAQVRRDWWRDELGASHEVRRVWLTTNFLQGRSTIPWERKRCICRLWTLYRSRPCLCAERFTGMWLHRSPGRYSELANTVCWHAVFQGWSPLLCLLPRILWPAAVQAWSRSSARLLLWQWSEPRGVAPRASYRCLGECSGQGELFISCQPGLTIALQLWLCVCY